MRTYVTCYKNITLMIFSRTLLRYTFGLWHEPSVCHLSSVCLSVCLSICLSVTLLHPTQRLKLFGNIFAPPNSLRTRIVCNKFWAKIPIAFEICGIRGYASV